MVLAAGLGPAGYAHSDHAPASLTGSSKPDCFLGAGSVMHGMERRKPTCAGTGGLRTYMPITFVTFGLGYLAIIGVPPFRGLLLQGRHHRNRFRRRRSPWPVARRRGPARRGHHRVLHDAGDADDVLWGESVGRDNAHPHESPRKHDVADDRAGGGIGRRRWACSPSAAPLEHWLEPGRWRTRGRTLGAGVGHDDHHAGGGRDRWSASPTGCTRTRPIPETAPDGSALTVAARNDLYGDAFQRGRPDATGSAAHRRALSRSTTDAVDGASRGLAALIRDASERFAASCRPGSPASYALSMLGGAALLIAAVLVARVW